jgi:ketopantoate reductase
LFLNTGKVCSSFCTIQRSSRVAIVGTGALGSLLLAKLSGNTELDVWGIARRDHISALEGSTIQVEGHHNLPSFSVRVNMCASEEMLRKKGQVDIAIILTKGYHTHQMLQEVALWQLSCQERGSYSNTSKWNG